MPYGKLPDKIIEMSHDRRSFIKKVTISAAGLALGSYTVPDVTRAVNVEAEKSDVSFVTGNDRREMMFRVMKPLEDKIREGIRGKQVVIKVNLVGKTILSSTHVDAVRGVLDFLKPIYDRTVIIGEAKPPENFKTRNLTGLPDEYNAKLECLLDRPTRVMWIVDDKWHQRPINVIDTFLDPDIYMISLARMKVHNDVVATLSLKNVIMACPKEHYKQKKAAGRNERAFMHTAKGSNRKFLNFNIFLVAQKILPDLSIVDGYEGVERNGPHGPPHGFPVEHGVALAGTDTIAVDRVGADLMGINFEDIGYLNYCADAGIGQADLSGIRIIGPNPHHHVIVYRLHDNIEHQLNWKEGRIIDR